jgi:hypothetical protein
MSDKLDRLLEAGLLHKIPPDEYAAVLETMDDELITTLIDLKGRLDEAQATTRAEVPPYKFFMVPPF